MSLSSIFGDLFPAVTVATGPTQTSGGTQSLKFEVNGLTSDVYRKADQSQDVFQGARAFFGAQTGNTLQQQEDVTQEATGANEKFVTYTPPQPNSEARLDQLTVALFASRFLARGQGDNFQDQLGGQSAVSGGWDSSGTASNARNELLQQEHVDQVIEESKVRTVFDLRQAGDIWNQTGIRRIDGILDDQNAEANLLNHQRQGYTTADPAQKGNSLYDNPVTQFASTDGACSVNNLVQDVSSNQKSTSIIENLLDLRRNPTETLDENTTEVAISLNGDFVDETNPGRHQAISFLESIQEQALVQQAQAGFDEQGNPTGNGGVVVNNAIQTASNVQIGDVRHTTDILV
jgi:hypothetical protein